MLPEVTEIKLLQKQRIVQITFADNDSYELSCEYLRVFSPSAEVRGHANQSKPPVLGKQAVNITDVEAVGNYAVKFIFDDGHDSGIYSWQTLHELSTNYAANWHAYQQRVAQYETTKS